MFIALDTSIKIVNQFQIHKSKQEVLIFFICFWMGMIHEIPTLRYYSFRSVSAKKRNAQFQHLVDLFVAFSFNVQLP